MKLAKSVSYKNRLGEKYLDRYGLLSTLRELSRKSNSTGCSITDYVHLHRFIKQTRPQFFLECGTGISTYVIAKAMADYCFDFYAGNIKLVSMEHQEDWHKKALEVFPKEYEKFTEIKLSKITNFAILSITGVGYAEIPDYPYDAVFVDGPDGDFCNMDYLRLLINSHKPMSALIDGRMLTALSFQCLLGKKVVRLGDFHYVKPTCKSDLMIYEKREGGWNITNHLKRRVEENDGISLNPGVNLNV